MTTSSSSGLSSDLRSEVTDGAGLVRREEPGPAERAVGHGTPTQTHRPWYGLFNFVPLPFANRWLFAGSRVRAAPSQRCSQSTRSNQAQALPFLFQLPPRLGDVSFRAMLLPSPSFVQCIWRWRLFADDDDAQVFPPPLINHPFP